MALVATHPATDKWSKPTHEIIMLESDSNREDGRRKMRVIFFDTGITNYLSTQAASTALMLEASNPFNTFCSSTSFSSSFRNGRFTSFNVALKCLPKTVRSNRIQSAWSLTNIEMLPVTLGILTGMVIPVPRLPLNSPILM